MSDLTPFEPKVHRIDTTDDDTGWYEVVDPTDTPFAKGDVVYVESFDDENTTYRHGNREWRAGHAWFNTHFRFAPDGAARRHKQIADLMGEIDRLGDQVSDIKALGVGTVHVNDAGAIAGTALVASGSADQAKRQLAGIRNQSIALRKTLEGKSLALRALLDEQQEIMQSKLGEMQKVVEKMHLAIWTINLYLGTDETIHQIRAGEPSDAEVVIRQRVLFMDEECAIAAEQGGLDHRSIDLFDEWLIEDPAHLDQVLPEPKGIVALKPRRKKKEYQSGNIFTDAGLQANDKATYFLIRNGENLYRFWTSYEVGERLMPREDEFVKYFEREQYNSAEHRTERVPVRPGSKEWMEAQERADEARLPFYQFFLLLQGLVDRTNILQPIPPVQFANPATWGTIFRIVSDDDKALGDAQERFVDWLARVNGALDIGCRVVGCWNHWSEGIRRFADKGGANERLTPNKAELPTEDDIYTVDGRSQGYFTFKYARKERNWNAKFDWKTHTYNDEYKNKATCRVFPEDAFFINLDSPDCTVERMRFYLRNRLDRSEYEYMFPVLKTAIAAKEREIEEEAPFRTLLVGQIAKEHGVSVEDADAVVDDLIVWYKTANRWHRALLVDDAKALRLIIGEFGRRQKLTESNRDGDALLVANAYPDRLLVAQKPDGNYAILVPENQENIFVREITWPKHTDKRWKTVDARHRSWRVVERSARFDNWKINASQWEHLTDPERKVLADDLWQSVSKPGYVLLAKAAVPENKTVRVWYWTGKSDYQDHISVQSAAATWKRGKSRDVVLTGKNWELGYKMDYRPGYTPWADSHSGGVVIEEHPESLPILDEAHAAMVRRQAEKRARADALTSAIRAVERRWREEEEAVAFRKFVDDYNDPTLWEEARKKRQAPKLPYDGLARLVGCLVSNGVNPGGMTLAAAYEAWSALDEEQRKKSDFGASYGWKIEPPPDGVRDYTIPPLDGAMA